MIDYNLMEVKIKRKEAEIIKVSQRRSSLCGKYIKVVNYHENSYKLCPYCLFYKTFDNFTLIKTSNSHHSKCKTCRSSDGKGKYRHDINTHIRARLHSINTKVKKQKDKCTIDELTDFFHNARCQYTGRTLVEEWENPNPNPNLRLEIDHIMPVSVGGSSKPNNLQVLPKAINALKKDCTPEQFRETLDFISQFVGVRK